MHWDRIDPRLKRWTFTDMLSLFGSGFILYHIWLYHIPVLEFRLIQPSRIFVYTCARIIQPGPILSGCGITACVAHSIYMYPLTPHCVHRQIHYFSIGMTTFSMLYFYMFIGDKYHTYTTWLIYLSCTYALSFIKLFPILYTLPRTCKINK